MYKGDYWFEILPHSYYVYNNEIALVYNTSNGQYIQTSDKAIVNVLEKMHQKENLGVIKIGEYELNNLEINDFIKESVEKEICKIEEVNPHLPKPIQLMPILNLQKDIDKLQKEKDRSLGENVLQYISDVTIYLNDECVLNCDGCGKYDKQFFHCWKSLNSDSLEIELLKNLFNQLKYASVKRLAITGGNIFIYPYFKELILFLKEEQIFPTIGVHYKILNKERVAIIQNFPTEVFITFPIDIEYLNHILKIVPPNFKFIFEITSENDYSLAESLISEFQIENFEFRPFFNDENEDFFSSNVFLTAEDILSTLTIQRIIFARQKMNTNYFGVLYFYPNGEVKANPLKQSLGNYKVDHLLSIIKNELIQNTSWRVIRNQEPCDKCIYQFLCPSPSNYELVMRKNNLCNII